MKTTWNEITVNTDRQKALINHFIKELFGNSGLRKNVKKYPYKEYVRVVESFTVYKCFSLQDCLETVNGLYPEDEEILLSFLKHYALKLLRKSETISIKDHLSNHIAITGMLRINDFSHIFGDDRD